MLTIILCMFRVFFSMVHPVIIQLQNIKMKNENIHGHSPAGGHLFSKGVYLLECIRQQAMDAFALTWWRNYCKFCVAYVLVQCRSCLQVCRQSRCFNRAINGSIAGDGEWRSSSWEILLCRVRWNNIHERWSYRQAMVSVASLQICDEFRSTFWDYLVSTDEVTKADEVTYF